MKNFQNHFAKDLPNHNKILHYFALDYTTINDITDIKMVTNELGYRDISCHHRSIR